MSGPAPQVGQVWTDDGSLYVVLSCDPAGVWELASFGKLDANAGRLMGAHMRLFMDSDFQRLHFLGFVASRYWRRRREGLTHAG